MESGERLAAYLAGDLDAEETRAVEAALARDPALRARLAAIAATDDLLASLPDVELPDGFSERLRSAVATELDGQLGDSAAGSGDELAARRTRRTDGGGPRRSWLPQIAVAAAVLAIAGIGIGVLSGGMGGGDEETTAEMAGGDAGTMEALSVPEPEEGPIVVAQGRSFDADSLAELADQPDLRAVLDQRLGEQDAAVLADEGQRQFEAPEPESAEAADGADTATDAGEDTEDSGGRIASAPAAELRTAGEVSEEDLEAVRACLPSLLEAQTAVIPVYAELATFEGQDAIVYGLVSNEPVQDEYRRVELWVVGRGDCQVLHFAQFDR